MHRVLVVEGWYLDKDRLEKSVKHGIPHEMAAFKRRKKKAVSGGRNFYTHFPFHSRRVFMQSLPKLRNISRKLLLPLLV